MSNLCPKCKIELEEDRSHCPLCGKCVDEDNLNKPRRFDYYPDNVKWKRDRGNLTILLTILLIALNLIWIVVEYLIYRRLYYCWFVSTASVLAFLLLIWPLTRQHNLLKKSIIGVLGISAFLLFIELYTGSFGWGMGIVIPMVLLGYDVAIWMMMLLRGYFRRSSLYPCLFIAIAATLVAVLNITLLRAKVVTVWPSITILAVSWGTFLLLFLFRYKKIVKGMKKDFHI